MNQKKNCHKNQSASFSQSRLEVKGVDVSPSREEQKIEDELHSAISQIELTESGRVSLRSLNQTE